MDLAARVWLGVCSLCLLNPLVYWLRSNPTVQAVSVTLNRNPRVHQLVGAIAIPTTLLSLLAFGTLVSRPMVTIVPLTLLGQLLLVALPLTGLVLTVYLHCEFYAAVAVFQYLPQTLFGTPRGRARVAIALGSISSMRITTPPPSWGRGRFLHSWS